MSHTAKKARKMMATVRKIMNHSTVMCLAQADKRLQDFFGFQKIYTDEAAREWLQDPKNLLLAELYVAELLARRGGKRKTMETHKYELALMENLVRLRDALWEGHYYPSRGTVHVIFDPVQREIFSAPYIDRILHHWVVGTILKWWDKHFIYDSYSCRKDKGTLFGVKRLQHHILTVSDNMTKKVYVIQLDISGYFMHIQRDTLYDLVVEGLEKQFPPETRDKRYQILLWALGKIIFDDPTDGVKIQGSYRDWIGLPEDKSLIVQPEGQGLVIGNYTSQMFSNIYLNKLDWFITQTLGWKHYGRYVDDFFIVVTEEELPQAKRDIQAIQTFLAGYGLHLNKKKTRVTEAHKGIKFLGTVVKGHRIFPGRRIVSNFYNAVKLVVAGEKDPSVVTSYLGMFSHFDAGRINKKVFASVGWDYVYDKKR